MEPVVELVVTMEGRGPVVSVPGANIWGWTITVLQQHVSNNVPPRLKNNNIATVTCQNLYRLLLQHELGNDVFNLG